MMRRELFTAAPLLALPTLFSNDAAPGITEDQTDCERIFRSWNMQRDRINGPEGSAMTEAEYNQAMELFEKLDDEMRMAPAQTARDFILKVIVLTEYGCCGLPMRSNFAQIWEEAERFANVPCMGKICAA